MLFARKKVKHFIFKTVQYFQIEIEFRADSTSERKREKISFEILLYQNIYSKAQTQKYMNEIYLILFV